MLNKILLIIFFSLIYVQGSSQDTVGITEIYLQTDNNSVLLAYSKNDSKLFTGYVCDKYSNHQIQFVTYYKEGCKISTTSFYDNGEKSEVLLYVDGKLQGSYFCWDEDGKILIEGKYENGLEHGFWTFYNHGVRNSFGTYRFGCKSGIWKYFNEKGEMIKKEFYEGCKIKSVKEY